MGGIYLPPKKANSRLESRLEESEAKNLASEHWQKDLEIVEVDPGNISRGHVWKRREGHKAKLEAGGRAGRPSASSCSLRAKLACLQDGEPQGRMD